MDPKTRIFWMAVRQALLALLAALECYLGIERSREGRKDKMGVREL